MTITVTPPACGRDVQPRLGDPWRCSEKMRCDHVGCIRLGDALASAGYAYCEFSDAWAAVLAWNLTFGALLNAAADQMRDWVMDYLRGSP